MNPSFREILEVLNEHEVEFIVVGGVAAVVQGAPVTTFDLDALVRIHEDNAERLSLALNKLDARYREHQSVVKPTKEDVLAGGHLLLLTRAGPLDLLGFIGDKSRYEDMLPRSTEISMGAGDIARAGSGGANQSKTDIGQAQRSRNVGIAGRGSEATKQAGMTIDPVVAWSK